MFRSIYSKSTCPIAPLIFFNSSFFPKQLFCLCFYQNNGWMGHFSPRGSTGPATQASVSYYADTSVSCSGHELLEWTRQSGPEEHFKIKWGQSYLVWVICPPLIQCFFCNKGDTIKYLTQTNYCALLHSSIMSTTVPLSHIFCRPWVAGAAKRGSGGREH